MRAFDVVGENLEFGLEVDRRGAIEQQPAQALLTIGLLRAARHLDARRQARRRYVLDDRAPNLPALPAPRIVPQRDRAFLALATLGQQRAAQFGIGRRAVAGDRDRKSPRLNSRHY